MLLHLFEIMSEFMEKLEIMFVHKGHSDIA